MTYLLLGVMFTLALSFFGYGFATTIGLLPSAWGIAGILQFSLLLIGALVGSLVALVTGELWRRDHPRPLTRKRAILTSLSAAVIAFVAVLISWELRTGDFTRLQFQEWFLFGAVVVSFQFVLGTVQPSRKRRLLLVGELVVVFVSVFLFGFVSTGRGEINLVSYSFVSGGASLLLLLFGGPLYLLGNRLSSVPQ
ncbi:MULTISPECIES: DUF4175 domain-containing protein [Haloferax]|uniref:Uncharacterized protein n=1 Tax=Haloferax marinum TaxID=2666143 RepID=A0A6A8G5P3_9EURY|nr:MULTISPECIES: DUF4175 domain-containing protein [Haloferax]KAB1197439.1 DUF4175 domain-containing protein [Haloferax sp. CBA1150]MRW96484.1 hypothetical protein [Haloferax marinum]